VLDRAPLRERIPSLGEALRLAPEPEREAVALRLFELAAAGRAPVSDGALGPVELLTRWPDRLRVRHAELAMHHLVSGWDRIPESVRPLASGLSRERWIRQAAQAAGSPDPSVRTAVARFAEDTADPGFAGLVCALLRDEHQRVRLHADRALLRLAMSLLTHIPEPLLGADFGSIASRPVVTLAADPSVLDLERVELCRRLADASWSFAEHRCRAPLIGALLVLDRVPGGVMERAVASRIRRLLNESGHPSHSPIRTVLRRTPSPLLRERALRWIVLDPVRVTCVDRLSAADSIEEHEVTLRRAYLALRARRGTRLKAVRPAGERAHAPVPDARSVEQLSPEARRGMVRFAQLIGIEEEARRVALEPTLADPDPLVRLAGAHAAHPADLSDYAFDADPSVARSAATRWSTLGVTPPPAGTPAAARRREIASLLARSPHDGVRSTAALELARLDPFAPHPAGRLVARRLLERDPPGFVRLVRAELGAGGSALNALMLIRSLRLEARFEMDLMDLASNAPDDRTRATAVAALGTIDSDPARRVVRASLNAPDQRVRSNAVEAVAADDAVLLEYKDDRSHRVRASAVRRVLSTPGEGAGAGPARESAAETLARMLGDDRPEHRLSGAWAAERVVLPGRRPVLGTGWRSVVRSVTDAAERDADDRVRLRAARCLRRLELERLASEAA
jgi:hypothetical protein